MDSISVRLFQARAQSICVEMGEVLRRSSLSPNIKERLDFSCALFDAGGGLCAQAAHIPVHLGSMAYAMAQIVARFDWQAGDVVVWNDPFLGGTHLPDVTLASPVFVGGDLVGFVANRAHHANIGASEPGSMPISTRLEEEGVVIAPVQLLRAGETNPHALQLLASIGGAPVPDLASLSRRETADFHAQLSANRLGEARALALIERMGVADYRAAIDELNAYGLRLVQARLQDLPNVSMRYVDYLDDDGVGTFDIPIMVEVRRSNDGVEVDFSGSAMQVRGNVNCPISVTAAAVFYVFRCLLPDETPACAGVFTPIRIIAPRGSLLNAERPAAVAAGNVETSMRIVDVLLGALANVMPGIPAASQGTMNNVAMGARQANTRWDYYETIAGGHGAVDGGDGIDGRHSHMTNTLNTPVESLEQHYPLRIRRYGLRHGSGGRGQWRGGAGVVREFEFLQPARVTLLTERRRFAPWGLAGGGAGAKGANYLNDALLPGKVALDVKTNDRLRIETPGGGGFGADDQI